MEGASDLYGLALDRFVPERAALAKKLRAEGKRDEAARVVALRKPSVAAWAVNQLVRTQAKLLSELFACGDELQHAQEQLLAGRGNPDALRAATARERDLVDDLTGLASGLLASDGSSPSAGTLERVSETLHAAALQTQPREAVRSGCLERELRHVGLGSDSTVDLAARAPAPAAESVAAEEVAADHVAADDVAAEEVAAEGVAAEEVAAEEPAAVGPPPGVTGFVHIGLVVEDLDPMVEFLTVLGLDCSEPGTYRGAWIDRIIGLENSVLEMVMVSAPDGRDVFEVVRFKSPTAGTTRAGAGDPAPAANQPGMRHVAFAVDDLRGLVDRLRDAGWDTVGEIVDYESTYLLCYVRGPEGVIFELAQRLEGGRG